MHLEVPIPPNPMEELEKNKRQAEQELRGKELYESRKRQRDQKRGKEKRKERLGEAPKKIGQYVLYTAIGVAVIGGLAWFVTSRPNLPPATDANHAEKSPPAHIVTEPIPERIQRHMLEHADGIEGGKSGIIIQYNCSTFDCEPDLIEKLTKLVEEYPANVYLAPNDYDGKIILTKLGNTDVLDEFDEEKIRDFIE